MTTAVGNDTTLVRRRDDHCCWPPKKRKSAKSLEDRNAAHKDVDCVSSDDEVCFVKTTVTLIHPCGISMQAFHNLCALGAPVAFFNILRAVRHRVPGSPSLRCLDGFCGHAAIMKSFLARNQRAVGYDRSLTGRNHDILTAEGFCTALVFCLSLMPGKALSHWGPPCSSWVYMSRGSTGRRVYNPMGILLIGETTPSVGESNMLVSRLVLLLMLCTALQVIWILEQPSSSLMFLHTRLQELCARLQTFRCQTWMGAFGGPSAKSTDLLSNHTMVHTLKRKLCRKHMSLS